MASDSVTKEISEKRPQNTQNQRIFRKIELSHTKSVFLKAIAKM